MTMSRYVVGTLVIAIVGGAYVLFVASPYLQAVTAVILIYTVAVSGLNLLAGYGGYPNLGQATFMGVAAYFSAWATNNIDWGFWPLLLVAPLIAAGVALVVALPLLRLKGQYFAIATLLLGVVLTTILANAKNLGGSVGIGGFDRPGTGSVQWLTVLIVITALVTLGCARVVTLPVGRHLLAIRRDESLSESIGIPVYRRKLQAFVLGGLIGGIAGVLLSYNSYFISPDLFSFYESFLLFVALIVGGSGTVSGPLLGSAFMVGLPELFRFAAEGRYLTMGLVFIIVMAIAPDGIAGLGQRLAASMSPLLPNSRGRPEPAPATPTPMKTGV